MPKPSFKTCNSQTLNQTIQPRPIPMSVKIMSFSPAMNKQLISLALLTCMTPKLLKVMLSHLPFSNPLTQNIWDWKADVERSTAQVWKTILSKTIQEAFLGKRATNCFLIICIFPIKQSDASSSHRWMDFSATAQNQLQFWKCRASQGTTTQESSGLSM